MKNRKTKEKEFTEFFETNQQDVYAVCMYFLGREDAAAEITQKAFFNLYLHYDKVDARGRRAYVIRTARNLTYNWIRDTRLVREGMIVDLTDDSVLLEDVEAFYIRQEEKRLAAEFGFTILMELYEKNKRWYEAILSVLYLGKSLEEVSEELGVSREVVSSRIYRAKKWLKKQFKEEYEQYEKAID